METNRTTASVLLFLGVVQFVLFLLKAINVLNWDWLWILSPLWVPYALFVIGGTLLIIYLFIENLKERFFNKQ